MQLNLSEPRVSSDGARVVEWALKPDLAERCEDNVWGAHAGESVAEAPTDIVRDLFLFSL